MRLLGVLATSAVILAACGSAGDDPADGAEKAFDIPVDVVVTGSGFGQLDEYVHGVVVVTSADDRAVGGFVTASMNFLDASGEIVGTSEQVESFSWAGQDLVLPLPLDLSATPGVEVAEVNVSVSLSDYVVGGDAVKPLETVEAREIRADEFGTTTAVFEVANPTESDLDGARIGIVCRDAAGMIIGGTSEYPNLIAAGTSALVESTVATAGEPATCAAYPNYGL